MSRTTGNGGLATLGKDRRMVTASAYCSVWNEQRFAAFMWHRSLLLMIHDGAWCMTLKPNLMMTWCSVPERTRIFAAMMTAVCSRRGGGRPRRGCRYRPLMDKIAPRRFIRQGSAANFRYPRVGGLGKQVMPFSLSLSASPIVLACIFGVRNA